MKSITDLKTEIINILDQGLEGNLITVSDYDRAINVFDEFASSHPDFKFLSPKEKKEQMGQTGNSDEANLWQSIQPILDKAQAIHTSSAEENASILSSAREADPLRKQDFTPSEVERLKVLAPEEYKNLAE